MAWSLSILVFVTSLVPALLAFILYSADAYLVIVWAFLYMACIGFVIAIAALKSFGHKTTWILGKGPDGLIRFWSWVIFLPYHLALYIKLLIGRSISKEPLYSQILPGWFLGGWPSHERDLPFGNPTVVDVTCELRRTHHHKYMLVPVWDTSAPTLQQLNHTVEFCISEAAEGRPLYIHCAHGHGRSASVMAACLIASGMAKGIGDAVSMMQAVRPRVRLTEPQQELLECWLQQRQLAASKSCDGGEGGLGCQHQLQGEGEEVGLLQLIPCSPSAR